MSDQQPTTSPQNAPANGRSAQSAGSARWLPWKPTPVLHGKDVERFLKQVEDNLKRDHSKAFQRAKRVYDRFVVPNAQAEARHRMPLPQAPGSAQKEDK